MPAAATDVVMEPEVPKTGWKTSEFWTAIAAVLGNFVFGLVLMGKMSTEDAQQLSAAINGIVTSLPIVIANAMIIWKYMATRSAVKSNAASENTRRLEVRENMRMEMRLKMRGDDPANTAGPRA